MQALQRRHYVYHDINDTKEHGSVPFSATLAGSVIRNTTRRTVQVEKTVVPLSLEDLLLEQEECHLCQLALFSTSRIHPVTITNKVDSATLPSDFEFIEESTLGIGVDIADDGFRMGCDCEDDGDCRFGGCHCLSDVPDDESLDSRRRISAYSTTHVRKGCLKKKLLTSRKPLYECHDRCACSQSCHNRVVERGRQIPLEIFRTSDGRGWGVRSSMEIQEGQFVDRYVGEIITSKEAHNRREESDIAQRKDIYLFALDKFYDPDSNDPRLTVPPYEVDGEFKAGPTRFINHSCDPNLRIFARVGDHADKPIHDLAFFAVKKILPNEELTFDYVDGDEGGEHVAAANSQQNMAVCLCGSENCRGYLW